MNLESLLECQPLPNDPNCWAFEIIKFFDIKTLMENEKKSALRIEKFLINCKKILIKNKFQQMIYKLRNMVTNMQDLPSHILVSMFEFFDMKEKFKYSQISKEIRECSKSAYLWKEVTFNKNTISLNH